MGFTIRSKRYVSAPPDISRPQNPPILVRADLEIGAIPRHPCQPLGRHCIRNRRLPLRSLPDTFSTSHSDGAYRYNRLRHPSLPRIPWSPILRNLPCQHRMFPLHRRKHHLAVGQLRARREACSLSRNSAYANEHWRRRFGTDLPEQCSTEVHTGPRVEPGMSGLCLVWLVDREDDV
jgi:hypothetical protein